MTIALLVALISVVVLFAALSFRSHTNTVRALEASHVRTVTYTQDLIDRLMAMDFGTYKVYTEEARVREEALEAIEPEPSVPTLGPDRGGFGSRLGLRALSVRPGAEEAEALMDAETPV